MRLWLDAEKMAAHKMTVLDVQRALRQQNVELPSGRVENVDREMTIQTRGELKTADEYNELVIRTEGTRSCACSDIGEARDGVENERTRARTNGKPCIFLGIVKQSKANTIEVARGHQSGNGKAIMPTLPVGLNTIVNYDESIYVEQAVEEVWGTLGHGIRAGGDHHLSVPQRFSRRR